MVDRNHGQIIACSVTGKLTVHSGGIANANYGDIIACWFNGTLKDESGCGTIVRFNYKNITSCYWGGNAGLGVLRNEGGTVVATKVDGATVKWQTAVDGMNTALTDNDYQWALGTDGLMNVAELVNGGKTDINITLDKNIDLTGKSWTPIGTDYDNSYTGTFDGGGHTITGLTVTTNDEYAGLFGYLGNFNNGAATVKNVVMDGIQITCNHRLGYAGGVAGFSWGTIENCSVSGSISGTMSVGGVVGVQRDHPITGCSSSATVKGTLNVGGVAGQTIFGATLTACYTTGNVIIEIDRTQNISGGGLVGFNDGISLLSCYATGNVTSTGSGTGNVHIGGFLGDNYITVTACYWKNNHEQGIGYNRESTKATKVDGTNVTWQNAVDAMNTALQNKGSEWRYELKGALPTLRKQ